MSYNILPTIRFEKELKRLMKKFPSLKREYSDLLINLETKPQQGTLLGNNCYKIRLAIASKGKGKRGGARIITYLYLQANFIYLLTIYDKSEKSNIEDKELIALIKSTGL